MKKYFLIAAIFILLFLVITMRSYAYVRKTLEPDFFIPQQDKLNQQEKLPPVSVDGKEISGIQKVVKKSLSVPGYRLKYLRYYEDVEKIARDGNDAENKELSLALKKMQNGEIFEVKETPLQESEVKIRFEEVLKSVLQEN